MWTIAGLFVARETDSDGSNRDVLWFLGVFAYEVLKVVECKMTIEEEMQLMYGRAFVVV